MVAALYPAATYEPVDYIGEAHPLPSSLGWILHVVVGDGDPWGTFEHAHSPNRRFSHLWFAKGGQVEQYQHLDRQSWAMAGGNPYYWSCETEGNPDEPLTDAQIDALARWHVWSGTPDRLAIVPGQVGVGTHQMGGAAWGGHACPGPVRAGQRTGIIARAHALRGGDMPLSNVEIDAIALKTRDGLLAVTYGKAADGTDFTLGDLLGEVRINAIKAAAGVDINALADAVATRFPAGAVDTHALAVAVADEVAERLKS